MSLGNNPLNNARKQEEIIELFYKLNFDKATYNKINLEKNSVVEKLKTATKANYVDQIATKKTGTVTNSDIYLDENQEYIKLVGYSSTHYYDKSNPQKGIISNARLKALYEKIKPTNPKCKTCVIFGGDLVGKEWQMKYLNNATITNGVINYYGLNMRKKQLIADINFVLKQGADVFLMRGSEEHRVMQELNRDVLQEIYEEIDSPNLHYINEGVSLAVNVIKKLPNNKEYKAVLGFQTNMLTKSVTANGNAQAAVANNGTLDCDKLFVFNANYAGKLNNNSYFVSGQSMYLDTAKNKKPAHAAKNYDVFSIYVEGNHDLTVVEGENNFINRNVELENKIHEESIKFETLKEICEEKLNEKYLQVLNEKGL